MLTSPFNGGAIHVCIDARALAAVFVAVLLARIWMVTGLARVSEEHAVSAAGVPSFMPLLAARKYFGYHHTAADTLDKVDPDNLRRHVAVMASTAWILANMDTPIGRAPVQLP